MNSDAIFLDLGKLDERLKTSPARVSWHLKMRARGVAFAAVNAGIPVSPSDVEQWLAKESLPPRYIEGINDDLSIASVAYFTLSTFDMAQDKTNVEAKILLQKIFNRHEVVMDWALEERDLLSPLFEEVSMKLNSLHLERSLSSVAHVIRKLLIVIQESCVNISDGGLKNAYDILPRDIPQAWIASTFLPLLLLRAKLLSSCLPSLIPPIRFVNMAEGAVEAAVRNRLSQEVTYGLRELDKLERQLSGCLDSVKLSKRSHAKEAAILLIAFPRLKRAQLANCLDITPQGAGRLKRQIAEKQT
jgi:hypothetical protein